MRKAAIILAITALILLLIERALDRDSVAYTIINYAFYADDIALIICCILPWKKKKELY